MPIIGPKAIWEMESPVSARTVEPAFIEEVSAPIPGLEKAYPDQDQKIYDFYFDTHPQSGSIEQLEPKFIGRQWINLKQKMRAAELKELDATFFDRIQVISRICVGLIGLIVANIMYTIDPVQFIALVLTAGTCLTPVAIYKYLLSEETQLKLKSFFIKSENGQLNHEAEITPPLSQTEAIQAIELNDTADFISTFKRKNQLTDYLPTQIADTVKAYLQTSRENILKDMKKPYGTRLRNYLLWSIALGMLGALVQNPEIVGHLFLSGVDLDELDAKNSFDPCQSVDFHADYVNASSTAPTTCDGFSSLENPFIQRVAKLLVAGTYTLKPIGEGITGSNFLLDAAGQRVAVLKQMEVSDIPIAMNWDCLVRDTLAPAFSYLAPQIAKIQLNELDFMAVEYVPSKPLANKGFNFINRNPELIADLQVIWLIDLLFSNTDRHSQNLLVTCEGQLKMIDHDLLFLQPSFRDNSQTTLHLYDFFDQKRVLSGAQRFINSLTNTRLRALSDKYAPLFRAHFDKLTLNEGGFFSPKSSLIRGGTVRSNIAQQFYQQTKNLVKWIKLFAESEESTGVIDGFVRTKVKDAIS